MSAALEGGDTSVAARLERLAAERGAGRYTVLGEIARGGMGRILRVWDERLAREVAMKVVPRAAGDEGSEQEHRLARFLDEARITAQLDHPGVVSVHEIGLDEDGAVYFTMPLVRGKDLKHVFALVEAGADGWSLQRALTVVHTVCLTVAFAHSRGVVHRDLKPENIMVGRFGEAYVMDWGLALLVGRAERESIVGTPAYMAPEQVAGRSGAVGPHSDVYSLGAILYELFARRVPHELSLETRPDEPGSLERVLTSPPRPLAELAPDVPPELAAICAKAMAHDPSERYRSALEMADDLAAWLAGRTVRALESGPWTRLVKWRARNRALALALDALAAVLVVSSLAFFLQQRILLSEVRAKNREVRAAAYAAGMAAADLGLRAHDAVESRRRLADCDPELRGWEWRHLAARADASTAVLAGHDGAVRAVAVAPDGAMIASGSDDGTVRLWDAATGVERARLPGHSDFVTALAFAPDGARLASASRDDTVRLWSLPAGTPERVFAAHAADVEALAWLDGGARLVAGDRDGLVVLLDASSGATLARREPDARDGIAGLAALAPSGEVAAACLSGYVRIYDAATLAPRREARVARTSLAAAAADPAGALLALAYERTVLVLDPATLAPLRTLEGHDGRVECLAFAPDGARLATGGHDDVLRLFELETGRVLHELVGHDREVHGVAFFPDGRRLVTASEDARLRTWDLARLPVRTLERRERDPLNAQARAVETLAFAPDGARLAAGGRDAHVRVFDVAAAAEVAALATPGIVDCLAWSARGELAFGCGEPAPRLVGADLAPRAALAPLGAAPRALAFDPAGARLFTRDAGGRIGVHELASGRLVAVLETGDETPTLAVSPDGAQLAAGTARGEVLVWDARSLAPRAPWRCGTSPVLALAFAPDGTRLAAGEGTAIVLLSAATGALERRLDGHENRVECLAFAPDGARLVSGANDRTLRVWTLEEEHPLLTLHGHDDYVTALAFHPAGEVVASASRDGTLRLWGTRAAPASAPARE